MKKIILIVLLFACMPLSSQVFKGGFVVGGAFSQIEGDDFSGYKKPGLQAGFVSDIFFAKKFSGSFEILYSQRGANSDLNPNKYSDGFAIRMNYLELPFLVKYHDKNKMVFSVGVALGRLLTASYKSQGLDDDLFFTNNPGKDWDICYTLMVSYPIYKFLSVDLKYNYSIVPFRYDPVSNFNNKGQYHNFVAIRLTALFNAFGQQKKSGEE